MLNSYFAPVVCMYTENNNDKNTTWNYQVPSYNLKLTVNIDLKMGSSSSMQ